MNNILALELRVQKWLKTRWKIRQALLELLENQEFQTIETEMIIKRSQVPSWIFYKCCNGKYDLIKSWIKEEHQHYSGLVKNCFEQENISYLIQKFVLKIESGDRKNIDIFLQKISPKQDDLHKTILTLCKICTPEINLHLDMKNILKQEFINSALKYIDPTKDWEHQATIFADLSLALQENYLMKKLM